jgi:transposase
LAEFTEIATVNEEMCIDIPRRLRDAVRSKRHEKWRINCWFLFHDNAPAHRSVLGKDFSARNKVTTVKHPPYSPHLTPADFYLFPLLKSALKDGVIVMLLTSLRMRWKS